METILLTGAGPTGVTGRKIRESLVGEYIILSPSSKELDLTSEKSLDRFFTTHHIDYIIHSAYSQTNTNNANLKMFCNIIRYASKVKKIAYMGSGAEYDKSRDIVYVTEDKIGECIPHDDYGIDKYIMNQYARLSTNIYNIRLFGTLNEYEPPTRNVISNMCVKALAKGAINLRQDCEFSFSDIASVGMVIKNIFEGNPSRHDYNVTLPGAYRLSELAETILSFVGVSGRTTFSMPGLARSYSADASALFTITPPCLLTNINDILSRIFKYWIEHYKEYNIELLDNRWK